MRGPRGALGGLDVGEDANARRGDGSAVEIVCAVHLCVGGEFRIDAGTAEQIQCDFRLGEKLVPQMKWKVLVDAAKSGNEVILEGADRAFGGIAAMHAGWNELKIDVGVAQERLERGGSLVIEAVQLWMQTGGNKACMNDCEGGENARARTTFHGFDQNGITVVVEYDHNVIIAGT